jgi:hypothetical protein
MTALSIAAVGDVAMLHRPGAATRHQLINVIRRS